MACRAREAVFVKFVSGAGLCLDAMSCCSCAQLPRWSPASVPFMFFSFFLSFLKHCFIFCLFFFFIFSFSCVFLLLLPPLLLPPLLLLRPVAPWCPVQFSLQNEAWSFDSLLCPPRVIKTGGRFDQAHSVHRHLSCPPPVGLKHCFLLRH